MIWVVREVSTFRTLIAEEIFGVKIMVALALYQALFIIILHHSQNNTMK